MHAACLLWSDERDLALEHALLRTRGSPGRLSDAKVDELDLPVVGHKHVLRAHVAMHDAEGRSVEVLELMSVGQAGQDISEDAKVNLER